MTEPIVLDYTTRMHILAIILGVNTARLFLKMNNWHFKMSHLITWREALSLCERCAAFRDPMPWEGNDD